MTFSRLPRAGGAGFAALFSPAFFAAAFFAINAIL